MTPVAAIYAFTALFITEVIAMVYFIIFFLLVGALFFLIALPFKAIFSILNHR